ncbi:HAD family hydrolase [Paludisphaera rhizosphaerae]|uniref:HAD family hydrolase n=1 Tax=Paludisphaera rhizosphaerae TaxID=2711216 RepID=UPI0013EC8272|nr:HAD family hydrolase [Paludisphaera rhizosphaerae]
MRNTLQLFVAVATFAVASPVLSAEPLPSWNEGSAKRAILEFVERATKQGGPEFIPPADRIAVFDNDGTLWSEKPVYVQAAFAVDRIKALAANHPEWKETQPFKGILEGDLKAALAGGEKALVDVVNKSHSGLTTEEFQTVVKDWIAAARHPTLGRPYNELTYQPMRELLAYLRANGFKTYIVSGGGVEFMRVWAEEAYGIPPEQVIGSSGKTEFEIRDGKPVLVKLPAIDFVDDGPGKPVNINKIIGRRPVAAFGNSDGDLQMLQWTTAGSGLRFGLIVHHTDADREFAYDRESPIGRLDKALDLAPAAGWVVVDMKADWKVVFPQPK